MHVPYLLKDELKQVEMIMKQYIRSGEVECPDAMTPLLDFARASPVISDSPRASQSQLDPAFVNLSAERTQFPH